MRDKLRTMLQRIPRVRLIAALGLTGMALILLSGLRTPRAEPDTPAAPESSDLSEAYRTGLEARLTAWLSQMDGVGQVKVMVTLSGSAEQQFAEEVKSAKSDRSVTQQSEIVLTRRNGTESALIASTRAPEICGVAVLCAGGDRAAIRERVSTAVTTVLGIPARAVYVGKTNS